MFCTFISDNCRLYIVQVVVCDKAIIQKPGLCMKMFCSERIITNCPHLPKLLWLCVSNKSSVI